MQGGRNAVRKECREEGREKIKRDWTGTDIILDGNR